MSNSQVLKSSSREPKSSSRELMSSSQILQSNSREPKSSSQVLKNSSREPMNYSQEPMSYSREPNSNSREPIEVIPNQSAKSTPDCAPNPTANELRSNQASPINRTKVRKRLPIQFNAVAPKSNRSFQCSSLHLLHQSALQSRTGSQQKIKKGQFKSEVHHL